ncbi:hypothetical protein ACFL5V_06830 [Fibrobacterota bacterium]
MRLKTLGICIAAVLFAAGHKIVCAGGFTSCKGEARASRPVSNVPSRLKNSITGSEFAKKTTGLTGRLRQKAAVTELKRGNMPDFMRTLYPVTLSAMGKDSSFMRAVIWVSPDYLSIGSDPDFLRMSLSLPSASMVLRRLGCVLPTRKMVDSICVQAHVRLEPRPMRPGPRMRSSEYYLRHQRIIEEQRRHGPVKGIIAGQKKDVVLTNLLWKKIGRIAIYGWQGVEEKPIQPLSTVHGENYADYSHGIRLVSDQVCFDGRWRSIYDVLGDSVLAPVLTYENVIRRPRKLIGRYRQ